MNTNIGILIHPLILILINVAIILIHIPNQELIVIHILTHFHINIFIKRKVVIIFLVNQILMILVVGLGPVVDQEVNHVQNLKVNHRPFLQDMGPIVPVLYVGK